MNPQETIEILSTLLVAANRCLTQSKSEEAWGWYSVFTTAYALFGGTIPEDTVGLIALEVLMEDTRKHLRLLPKPTGREGLRA